MPDFNKYLARHGEFWIQDLIERMERYDGIRSDIYASLESRWERLMQSQPQSMAA